jgi:hypothetical protein
MLRIISQAKLPLPTHFDKSKSSTPTPGQNITDTPLKISRMGAFEQFGWKLTMFVSISNASCLGRWK